MLITSILIWILLIYNLRVAVKGDPLAKLLFKVDRSRLEKMEAVFQQHKQDIDVETASLLKRFSRVTLIESTAFVGEMSVLAYLMFQDRLFFFCLVLFMKNCIMVATSIAYARHVRTGDKFMSSFYDLPGWLHTVDRISALISGAGLAYIFFNLNNILNIFTT